MREDRCAARKRVIDDYVVWFLHFEQGKKGRFDSIDERTSECRDWYYEKRKQEDNVNVLGYLNKDIGN
jgi:hypothetical protein